MRKRFTVRSVMILRPEKAPGNEPRFPTTESTREASSLMSSALQYASIVAAIAYIGGWVYLQRYFIQFDIHLTQLELGWHDIIIHSVELLRQLGSLIFNSKCILLFLLALPAVFWAINRQSGFITDLLDEFGPINTRFYLPFLVFLLLLMAYVAWAQSLAVDRARMQWDANTPGEEVLFSLKSDCHVGVSLQKSNDSGDLRLLHATPKLYFVLARNGEVGSGNRHVSIRTFQIPADCVQSVTSSLRDRSG